MNRTAFAGLLLLGASPLPAQEATLLPPRIVAALAQEVSGEAPKRNLEFVTTLHRTRGSRGWHAAAERIVSQLNAYGITDVRIEQFPADGRTWYGTQRARQPWDADFAELWELRRDSTGWVRQARLASWETAPITLAEDSESGEATADLVDVGDGTAESDYAGKDVKGKLVLAAQQPGPVSRLAVARYGAAGIVSYAQNQHTAWWGEDENLVRWGHLDSFTGTPTFAFMISLKQGRALGQRLARGEQIRLEAKVRAGRHDGVSEVVTAVIPGADPALKDQEIVYSCHLDHQRPGANDNASGCVTILEVARTLSKLIAEGRIPRPVRTLRFVWPPEIEGTLTFLVSHPELQARIKAAIHLDMVGGGPQTKAIFHLTRGPASLPSFVYDVGASFGAFVNRQSEDFAGTGSATFPLTSADGGKEPLRAEFSEYTEGSDHQVYSEGSFRIPAVYMNDWPDRYIHTNQDAADKIDPTKLRRVAFISAATGYYLATLGAAELPSLLRQSEAAALVRTGVMLRRRAELPPSEAAVLTRFHLEYERAVLASLDRFLPVPAEIRTEAASFLASLEQIVGRPQPPGQPAPVGRTVYRRNPDPKGPMSVFEYDYLVDKYGAAKAAELRLPTYTGLRGGGDVYSYEALNFVDGRRSVQDIRDALSAVYGPVPLDMVAEFLGALEAVGVLSRGP